MEKRIRGGKIICFFMIITFFGLLYVSCRLTGEFASASSMNSDDSEINKMPLAITRVKTSVDAPSKTGEKIVIDVEYKNNKNVESKNVTCEYEIKNNLDVVVDKEYVVKDNKCEWIPITKSNYMITAIIKDENGNTDRRSIIFRIDGEDSLNNRENTFVLYYAGMDKPVLNYQLDDSSMSDTTECEFGKDNSREGFSYRAVVDMKKSSKIRFNIINKDGKQENNGRAGYQCEPGIYIMRNGKVVKASEYNPDDFSNNSHGFFDENDGFNDDSNNNFDNNNGFDNPNQNDNGGGWWFDNNDNNNQDNNQDNDNGQSDSDIFDQFKNKFKHNNGNNNNNNNNDNNNNGNNHNDNNNNPNNGHNNHNNGENNFFFWR